MEMDLSAPESRSNLKSFWFPKGDLIIQVGGSPQHRVHSDVLAYRSGVFRDMVENAADPNEPVMDGCRVVELHDSPKDIVLLLEEIYGPRSPPPEKLRQATFAKLKSLFLIADKYDMKDVTDSLLVILERDWPTTLHAWDVNEAEIKITHKKDQKTFWDNDMGEGMDGLLPKPCQAIPLAGRFGLGSILPAAYYHLSRLELNYDVDGDMDEGKWEFLFEGGRTANAKLFNADELRTLQLGKDAIVHWQRGFFSDLTLSFRRGGSDHKTPLDRQTCKKAFDSLTRDLQEEFIPQGEGWGIDPLAVMASYQRPGNLCGLCPSCSHRLKQKLEQKRIEFWDDLPSFFGLGGWTAQESSDEDD